MVMASGEAEDISTPFFLYILPMKLAISSLISDGRLCKQCIVSEAIAYSSFKSESKKNENSGSLIVLKINNISDWISLFLIISISLI